MKYLRIPIAALLAAGLVACGDSTGSDAGGIVITVSGDEQEGNIFATLPDSLRVHVTDRSGRPRVGEPVVWITSEGSLSPTHTETDEAGTAATAWTLGGNTGMRSATALVGGQPPVMFTARVLVGPQVTGVSITPATVNVGSSAREVEVSITATDDGPGVSSVAVGFINPSGTQTVGLAAPFGLGDGTAADGTWYGTVTIPMNVEPGVWLATVRVRNGAGYMAVTSASVLEAQGLPYQLTVTADP